MEELKKLVAARGYSKAAITRALKFATEGDMDKDSRERLSVRRERLVKAFNDYDNYNIQIATMDPADNECVQEVEESYFQALACFDKSIGMDTTSNNVSGSNMRTAKTRLPPIEIRSFDGNFTDYIPFINLYKSMIDSDTNLDPIQKLYYLRSFLKNEPYALIKNLPITEASYNEALKILHDRYNNKLKIVSSHINNILDCKSITRSTASSLREFVSVIRQEMAAIKNHEPNAKYWDAVLVCVLSRKLDAYTSKAFQLDRDIDAPANLEDLLKYLERRALALENAEYPPANTKVVAHMTTPQEQPTCSYYTAAESAASEGSGAAGGPSGDTGAS